jgi:hypothetical protein
MIPISRVFYVVLLAGMLLSGCATPVRYTSQPLQRHDRDTTFRIDEHESGFTITVYYSRYQFIPESDAVNTAGRSALMSIAYDVAEGRGRAIEPINEQRIKMSMGRNGLSGITSWSGTVKVFYRGAKQ